MCRKGEINLFISTFFYQFSRPYVAPPLFSAALVVFCLSHLRLHLADSFIQSDLQLLYMSEVARLWSN